jgi:hypothetical protein
MDNKWLKRSALHLSHLSVEIEAKYWIKTHLESSFILEKEK